MGKAAEQFSEANSLVTVKQFIVDQQAAFPYSTGAFSRLLRDISLAAKIVSREIRRAGLVGIYGDTGLLSVHGEAQHKLDIRAHSEFMLALTRGGECCLIGSEEDAEAVPIEVRGGDEDGKYIVLLDPLDGSSNIDVGVSVGTIFSIYRRPDEAAELSPQMVLQPGQQQVAAGYVVYGSSTMVVYTTAMYTTKLVEALVAG